jgi:two-component system alkaline phosphatase synthesis response regulator PhoP
MTVHSMKRKLLLIEDEPSLVLTLEDRLRAEGYEVHTATDGLEGYGRALAEDFDLLLLDLHLPGKGGLDICRDLRREGRDLPILMLTARGQVVDKVVGLKLGADDYLAKPFDMMELAARLEVLLRRGRAGAQAAAGRFSFGDVEVDFEAAEVKKAGRPVELSTLELRLLRHFLDRRGKVVSRDELLDKVWGYDSSSMTRTVDVHVSSLRQKIEDQSGKPRHLITVHGQGYKFIP